MLTITKNSTFTGMSYNRLSQLQSYVVQLIHISPFIGFLSCFYPNL